MTLKRLSPEPLGFLDHLRRKGRHCSTTDTVSKIPMRIRSWGARKMQKTMQSRYETGPRIIFAGFK
jgi:hypothetical protein